MANDRHNIEPSPVWVVMLLICFIGFVSGIFTGWITRYEYEAINRMLSRYSIENNGLEYVIFCIVDVGAAVVICFGRIPKLPIGKALLATCLIFAGGCLGALIVGALPYSSLWGFVLYFAGLGVGNILSRKLGM